MAILTVLDIALFALIIKVATCSVAGITYYTNPFCINCKEKPKGEDPCNPLYWYPKHLPDYCYRSKEVITTPAPIVPIAIPIPAPIPIGIPLPPPYPMANMLSPYPNMPISSYSNMPLSSYSNMPLSPYINMPTSQLSMPTPYSMLAMSPESRLFPSIQSQSYGYVPPIEGIVTKDGGINVLPFSDAYSDLLERKKQKLITKRLERLLDDYSDYPYK